MLDRGRLERLVKDNFAKSVYSGHLCTPVSSSTYAICLSATLSKPHATLLSLFKGINSFSRSDLCFLRSAM